MGETRRKLTRRIDDKAARKRSFYRGWFWGWCSIARGYPDADRRRESLSELLSLLPVHRREAAVELRSEFHTFVHVDRTFHGVSGGDQRRRSLQARGLQRGFLFIGHKTDLPFGAPNADERWSSAVSLCRTRVAQWFIARMTAFGLSGSFNDRTH